MVKAIEFKNKHGFMLRGFLDLPENIEAIDNEDFNEDEFIESIDKLCEA